MDDLRWALLILGALFLAGLGLWELRRSRARQSLASAQSPAPAEPSFAPMTNSPADNASLRREPSFDGFDSIDDPPVMTVTDVLPAEAAIDLSEDELPEMHAVSPPVLSRISEPAPPPVQVAPVVPPPAAPTAALRVGISAEEAVDVPGATTVVAQEEPKPIRWPPAELPERVLGLRVLAGAAPLGGKPLRLALQSAGLRHGPQQIFHKTDRDGNVLASVANLVRPGSLSPDQMDAQEFRGLSLFAVLPGPLPPTQMLEGLVSLARMLASRLGAVVQDEHGQELDAERLTQLRRAVTAIEDDGDGNGDGAQA